MTDPKLLADELEALLVAVRKQENGGKYDGLKAGLELSSFLVNNAETILTHLRGDVRSRVIKECAKVCAQISRAYSSELEDAFRGMGAKACFDALDAMTTPQDKDGICVHCRGTGKIIEGCDQGHFGITSDCQFCRTAGGESK